MTPLDDFRRLTKGVDLEKCVMGHELRQIVCAYCTWVYQTGVEADAIKSHCDIFHPGAGYSITAELMPVIPMVLLEIEAPTTRPTSTAGQPRSVDPVQSVNASTPMIEGSPPDVTSSRPGTPATGP